MSELVWREGELGSCTKSFNRAHVICVNVCMYINSLLLRI